jgi:uroporphyrinogen-III synthase
MPSDLESVRRFTELLRRGELAGVVFTSPLSVEHLLRAAPQVLEHLRRVRVVAIAPSTRRALERRGIAAAMPPRYTVEECLKMLWRMVHEQGDSLAEVL